MLIRLDVGVVRVMQGNDEVLKAVVDGGFLHVTTSPELTRVDVLADDAELARDVNVGAAERARVEAEAKLQRGDDEAAQTELKRALVRLSLTRS